MAQHLKTALLEKVDKGDLAGARTLLEALRDEHGIDKAVYTELSDYLLGGHTVHQEWEDALQLGASITCPKASELHEGRLIAFMAFATDAPPR